MQNKNRAHHRRHRHCHRRHCRIFFFLIWMWRAIRISGLIDDGFLICFHWHTHTQKQQTNSAVTNEYSIRLFGMNNPLLSRFDMKYAFSFPFFSLFWFKYTWQSIHLEIYIYSIFDYFHRNVDKIVESNIPVNIHWLGWLAGMIERRRYFYMQHHIFIASTLTVCGAHYSAWHVGIAVFSFSFFVFLIRLMFDNDLSQFVDIILISFASTPTHII